MRRKHINVTGPNAARQRMAYDGKSEPKPVERLLVTGGDVNDVRILTRDGIGVLLERLATVSQLLASVAMGPHQHGDASPAQFMARESVSPVQVMLTHTEL